MSHPAPGRFLRHNHGGGLTFCTLLVLGAALIISIAAPIVVSDVPKHHAKRMCFLMDPPAPADVAATSDSPMAVELPFPGEFVNWEFQVVYETL